MLYPQLTSENDLFFYYLHNLDDEGFKLIQKSQRLTVTYNEYPSVLIRMFNNCIKEPHGHLAVFFMQRDGSARLDFIQNMEYKFVELMSLNYIAAADDLARSQQQHCRVGTTLMPPPSSFAESS